MSTLKRIFTLIWAEGHSLEIEGSISPEFLTKTDLQYFSICIYMVKNSPPFRCKMQSIDLCAHSCWLLEISQTLIFLLFILANRNYSVSITTFLDTVIRYIS